MAATKAPILKNGNTQNSTKPITSKPGNYPDEQAA